MRVLAAAEMVPKVAQDVRSMKMDSCKFHISPRKLCQCGRTVRAMTEGEREVYDEALRKLAAERAEESEKNAATEESTESDASAVGTSPHVDRETPD